MWAPDSVEPAQIDKALRSNHRMTARVELWSDGTQVTAAAPYTDGVVTDQLGSENIGIGVRRSLALTVPPTPQWLRWLTLPGLEVRPYRGIDLGGGDTVVECPLGVYPIRVPEQERPITAIQFKADDYYSWVVDDTLTQPVQVPYGWTRNAIAWLLYGADPEHVQILTTSEMVAPSVWYTKTRHDAVVDLAQSIGCEVYIDRIGTPVIAPSRVLGAATGNLVGLAEGFKRTPNWAKVYNIVAATSTDSSLKLPVATVGLGWDTHPASPSNLGNRRRPLYRVYTYSSPLITTYDQAMAAADTILARVSALAETYSFTGIPDPRIDAGDSVIIPTVDDGWKVAQVASVTHPLTSDGKQVIGTIASNVYGSTDLLTPPPFAPGHIPPSSTLRIVAAPFTGAGLLTAATVITIPPGGAAFTEDLPTHPGLYLFSGLTVDPTYPGLYSVPGVLSEDPSYPGLYAVPGGSVSAAFTGAGVLTVSTVRRGNVTSLFTATGAFTATTTKVVVGSASVSALFTASASLSVAVVTATSLGVVAATFNAVGVFTAANVVQRRVVTAPFTATGVFTASVVNSTPVGFVHPGVLLSQPMITFTAANIGNSPWAARWATLLSRTNDQDPDNNVGVAFSSLSWVAHPVPNPISSGTNGGRWGMYTDGMAAWIDALAFVYTGDRVRGQKAVTIINSWMHTLVSIPFNSGNVPTGTSDGKLLAGWTGELFSRSAEVLRYLWNPTTTGADVDLDVTACIDKFTNIFYPAIKDGWVGGGANWLTTMCAATVNIGVFCDSPTMFQQGIDNWRSWASAYAYRSGDVNKHPVLVNLPHAAKGTSFDSDTANRANFISQEWDTPTATAPWPTGIWSETGRDSFHCAMGFGSLTNAAETAWHQGVDLYGEQGGRLISTMEKFARIIVTSAVDGDTTPPDYSAVWSGTFVPGSSNSTRATFEAIYNHYVGRMGASMPDTLDMLTRFTRGGTYIANLHLTGEAVTHRQNTAGRAYGNVMPVGDEPGWQQVTAVDFTTAVPIGGFVAAQSGALTTAGLAGYNAYGAGLPGGPLLEMYPEGWHSTDLSGLYSPQKCVSVLTNVKGSNGVLDIYCHTITVGAETLPGAAVVHPISTIGDPQRLGPYFRYGFRMRTTGFNGTGYHVVPLTIDSNNWPAYGELDWPECDPNEGGLISGWYHRADPGGSQEQIPSDGGRNRISDWHTYWVESLPGRVNFYLDDALMLTSTTMTPTQALYFVLQIESTTGTAAGTSGHVQFDWVVAYQQATGIPGGLFPDSGVLTDAGRTLRI